MDKPPATLVMAFRGSLPTKLRPENLEESHNAALPNPTQHPDRDARGVKLDRVSTVSLRCEREESGALSCVPPRGPTDPG